MNDIFTFSLSLPLGLSPNVTSSWFLNGQKEEPEVKWERGRAGDVMKSGREQGREEGIRGKRRRENGEEHEVPKKLNQLRYFISEIKKALLLGLEGLMPLT